MKSVLYFQSSINASNNSGLDGVRRYAKAAGWRVHVTPYADAAYLRGGHEDSARRPDEILSVRIERAEHLLEHSSKSVAQIASDCGYGSANALRKVFEPLVGMTPRAWQIDSSH